MLTSMRGRRLLSLAIFAGALVLITVYALRLHNSRYEHVQVDLGISGVAVNTHQSPIDVIAIQRLDAEIQKKASVLTPLKQVTLTWNEVHPQGINVYRRVVYFHEDQYLRDTASGSGEGKGTGGKILYLGVTPQIIHAMAVQSRQRHMTFKNLKDYGCRVEVTGE